MCDELIALKDSPEMSMNDYGKQIREFIHKEGNIECDYLRHRKNMEIYHRGAFNALNQLERSIKRNTIQCY
jgi:hypothetical protein